MEEALDKLNAAIAALEHLVNLPRRQALAQRTLLLASVHAPLLEAKSALEDAIDPPEEP